MNLLADFPGRRPAQTRPFTNTYMFRCSECGCLRVFRYDSERYVDRSRWHYYRCGHCGRGRYRFPVHR